MFDGRGISEGLNVIFKGVIILFCILLIVIAYLFISKNSDTETKQKIEPKEIIIKINPQTGDQDTTYIH